MTAAARLSGFLLVNIRRNSLKFLPFMRAQRGRRLIAGMLLAIMTVSVTGLPLAPAPSTQQSAPFPCQNTPCGCDTAEKCWRDCCCNTHAQKLAWAKRNNVTPPAYVFELAAAEREQHLARVRDTSLLITDEVAACCSDSSKHSCCSASDAPPESSCCHCAAEETEADSPASLLAWQAVSKCQGKSSTWSLLASGWMPEDPVEIASHEPTLLYTLALVDSAAESAIAWPDCPIP